MKRILPVTILAALLVVLTSPVQGKESTRGLYVEQLNKPAAKINNGVQYWLELQRNGKKTKVTNRSTFLDGDKLRIHVKPNFSGFAYVLLLQGSGGEQSVLFPATGLGANKVVAGREIVLPTSAPGKDAWMKFDENPGTEIVRVLISRTKIANPKTELPAQESVAIAGGDGDDNVPDDASVSIVASRSMKVRSSGSRNLTVENDDAPEEQGHTYVVGKADKVLSIDIALDHKPKG